jgi:hypothetical protein
MCVAGGGDVCAWGWQCVYLGDASALGRVGHLLTR